MTKKITRYTERYIFGDGVAEAEDGEYVLYSDYEDLQREVERLRAAAEPKAESDRMERLERLLQGCADAVAGIADGLNDSRSVPLRRLVERIRSEFPENREVPR